MVETSYALCYDEKGYDRTNLYDLKEHVTISAQYLHVNKALIFTKYL